MLTQECQSWEEEGPAGPAGPLGLPNGKARLGHVSWTEEEACGRVVSRAPGHSRPGICRERQQREGVLV